MKKISVTTRDMKKLGYDYIFEVDTKQEKQLHETYSIGKD